MSVYMINILENFGYTLEFLNNVKFLNKTLQNKNALLWWFIIYVI